MARKESEERRKCLGLEERKLEKNIKKFFTLLRSLSRFFSSCMILICFSTTSVPAPWEEAGKVGRLIMVETKRVSLWIASFAATSMSCWVVEWEAGKERVESKRVAAAPEAVVEATIKRVTLQKNKYLSIKRRRKKEEGKNREGSRKKKED